jgi:cysteinyl-tRNA synthetase
MSKSLGNVIKGNEFIDKFGPLLTRYILLATYYRAPLNISDDIIETSKTELNKITSVLNSLFRQIQLKKIQIDDSHELSLDTFVDALCDDLNISNAMAEIFRVVKEANQILRKRDVSNEEIVGYYVTLSKMLDILGLKPELKVLSDEDIELINQYNQARADKDFAKSDIIRAELIKKGLM